MESTSLPDGPEDSKPSALTPAQRTAQQDALSAIEGQWLIRLNP
jgi:hypothetical protein